VNRNLSIHAKHNLRIKIVKIKFERDSEFSSAYRKTEYKNVSGQNMKSIFKQIWEYLSQGQLFIFLGTILFNNTLQ